MEIPKGLAHITKKEIEKTVKKTLVEKIAVEEVAKGIKEYLESETIAKRMKIRFEKHFDFSENDLETYISRKKVTEKGKEHHVEIEDKKKIGGAIKRKEATKILESLRELEPDIEEVEILNQHNEGFDIVSKDVIYELVINVSFYDSYIEQKEVKTDETAIVGMFSKKEVPIIKVYHQPKISGQVKYVKFNTEHNKKLIKALEKNGYTAYIQIN